MRFWLSSLSLPSSTKAKRSHADCRLMSRNGLQVNRKLPIPRLSKPEMIQEVIRLDCDDCCVRAVWMRWTNVVRISMLFDVVDILWWHISLTDRRRPSRHCRSRLRREIQIRFHAYCKYIVIVAKSEVKGGLLDCCDRRRLELLLLRDDDTSVAMK